jgi:hypothetical protein
MKYHLPDSPEQPVTPDDADHEARLIARGWVAIPEPEPAGPEPAVPEPIQEVPAWRIHAMLDRTGLKNTVAGMLEALPEPAKFDAKAQFGYATVFQANNAFVSAAASKLGLSVQEFFQTAMTVPGSEVADLTDPGLIDRIKAWWNN